MKTAAAKLLPWTLAGAYLGMIAYIGLAFHQVAPYEVTEVSERQADDSSLPVRLSLIRYPSDFPTETVLTYRFDNTVVGQDAALFFPRMTSNSQIRVNGFLLQKPPVSFKANFQYQPQLISIPSPVLNAKQPNELRIDLRAEGPVMMLSVFYLGPPAALEPAFRVFDFFRQDLLHGAVAVAGLLAVFMVTIWLVRPQLNEFGWLALAFLAFTFYIVSFIGTRQTVDGQLYSWSYLLARAVFVWSFLCFVHQFLEYRRRWLEYGLGAFYLAVFGVGLVLVLNSRYTDFLRLTYFTSLPMVLLVICYVNAVLIHALIYRKHVYLHWLLVGSLLGLLLGVHDVLVLFDVQHWLIRDFYISHYAIVFITIGYGGVLVHRVAHALFNSEDLNLELNRQLEVRSAELEQAARQRSEQEKQLALYAERQRIMADMHDGVGGQLVGLIAANRDGQMKPAEIGRELDEILADLRLVLDALTPAGEDVVLALARLKERYGPLLRHAKIDLHWSLDPSIDSIPMPPSQTISVLRLVQEAVQNAVKHSNCANIWLSLAEDAATFQLSIRDDGVGLSGVDGSPKGHGMDTIHQRAAALAGHVSWTAPDSGGIQVTLTFPRMTSPTSDRPTH